MMAESSSGEAREQGRVVLREKFVQVYEAFFRGEDASQGREAFWQELFLLKVKGEYLEKLVAGISEERLLAEKGIVNLLFLHYAKFLKDDNDIRVANVLQTMSALLSSLFRKKFSNFGFDVVNLVMGFEEAELYMRDLLRSLQQLLKAQTPAVLRGLALNLLVVFVTATDNLNENTLLEYLMLTPIFDSLAQLLRNKDLREAHGPTALFVLTALINYRKNEAPNPYALGLAERADDIVLHGIGAIVLSQLMRQNAAWLQHASTQPQGIIESLSSMMSSWFVGAASEGPRVGVGMTGVAQLGLYETIHLSANFNTMLTHTAVVAADGQASPSPPAAASLLSEFITYTSFLFRSTEPEGAVYVRLAFVTLTCIAEDLVANAYLHDPNVHIPVLLHRVATRHRPCTTVRLPSAPLACAILELVVEYMVAHLRKNTSLHTLSLAVGIVHRLVAHQKRNHVRLPYAWPALWTAMLGLLRFALPKDGPASSEPHIVFSLASQVVAVFNVFVTYGDAFLPDEAAYDNLYYELLRARDLFEVLHEEAKSHPGDRVGAARLSSALLNIRGLTHHFAPKVDEWMAQHPGATITPEQVLALVRENYDTLTLKLQDNVEYFEPYSDVAEAPTLRQVLRALLAAYRSVRFVVEPLSVLPKE